MSPRVRNLLLTTHLVASIGWIGAVLAFLALAFASLLSDDADLVHGTYLAMELTGVFVLVPLAVASLVTGLAQSLLTPWGLFRHYWVVVKLVITLAATVLLVTYLRTLAHLADAARAMTPGVPLRDPSPALHGLLALLLLVAAAALGVYKPRGLTPYGHRRRRQLRSR